jgi:hypothetical protein
MAARRRPPRYARRAGHASLSARAFWRSAAQLNPAKPNSQSCGEARGRRAHPAAAAAAASPSPSSPPSPPKRALIVAPRPPYRPCRNRRAPCKPLALAEGNRTKRGPGLPGAGPGCGEWPPPAATAPSPAAARSLTHSPSRPAAGAGAGAATPAARQARQRSRVDNSARAQTVGAWVWSWGKGATHGGRRSRLEEPWPAARCSWARHAPRGKGEGRGGPARRRPMRHRRFGRLSTQSLCKNGQPANWEGGRPTVERCAVLLGLPCALLTALPTTCCDGMRRAARHSRAVSSTALPLGVLAWRGAPRHRASPGGLAVTRRTRPACRPLCGL